MKKIVFLFSTIVFGFSFLHAQQGSITEEMLQSFEKDYNTAGKTYKALQNAVSNNSIKKLALNRENLGKIDTYFSHKIESSGITDQESSGRCWLFTGLNVLRIQSINKVKAKKLVFSHNYLFFYDQLEKANLFLEGIIETRNLPLTDRKVEHLMKNAITDGGQWTGVVDLVRKYGLVPAEVFPESKISENTGSLTKLLKWKLREDALKLRNMKGASLESLRAEKEKMLTEIYRMLRISLGTPPKTFSFRYEDKDGNLTQLKSYTPQSFAAEFLDVDFEAYRMFMNDPTRPYYKVYEIEFDRHTYDGHNWKYLNLPVEDIKQFAKNSILDNQPMYFSCDVGKQLNKQNGTLDVNNYEYGLLFDVNFGMNKKERIETFSSGSSHGMALTGVDLDKDGNIKKWLLENSWGESYGFKGYLIMTDAWFDEYMFRLVVNKKYVLEKFMKMFDQKATVLPMWDPMFREDD